MGVSGSSLVMREPERQSVGFVGLLGRRLERLGSTHGPLVNGTSRCALLVGYLGRSFVSVGSPIVALVSSIEGAGVCLGPITRDPVSAGFGVGTTSRDGPFRRSLGVSLAVAIRRICIACPTA